MNMFDLPPSPPGKPRAGSSRPASTEPQPAGVGASVLAIDAGSIGRVLVLRDEPSSLPSIDRLLPALRRSGFFARACRADEAPALLARGAWDVLLVDIGLCAGEAIEWVRGLQGSPLACALPVMLLGNPSQTTIPASAALTAGAHDALAWPFDPVELAQRLANLTELSRLRRSRQDEDRRFQDELAARSASLDALIEAGLTMSMERDRSRLLRRLLDEGRRLLHCDGGTLYLVTDDRQLRFELRTSDDDLPSWQIPLYNEVTGRPNENHVSVYAALHGRSVLIDDVYNESRFDLSGTRAFDAASNYRTVSMLTVPIAPRGGEPIGVLQFMNALDPHTGEPVPFAADRVGLVEALAAQAAVALDNLHLVESQKQLTESLIRVLATAIDAKSPDTGRHCERVPELAFLLAEAACQATEGPLADFAFRSEAEWQEFRIGAWLHDCGKVTTPEHVIDKATKLETIYNRIHEVRMRFEVLLRDLEIERLQQRLRGDPEADDDTVWAARCQKLMADFAFVAQCNLGTEEMDDAAALRLVAIGRTPWVRHFDDRLGLSANELGRLSDEPVRTLPANEALLADRPRDRVPRRATETADPAFDFRMAVPAQLDHHGELYNLGLRRGTLTPEERYQLDEHMVHTITMLEALPFPKHLRRVPEYAGTHHERMDGQGYPRRLSAESLSVPSRIMAVADIFEALTAADRPHNTGRKLSEALAVLKGMAGPQIDVDVYNLFVGSGVFLVYASKYLKPEQIDVVDGRPYLRSDAAAVRLAPPRRF